MTGKRRPAGAFTFGAATPVHRVDPGTPGPHDPEQSGGRDVEPPTGHDPGTAAGHDPEPPTGHDPGTAAGHDPGTAAGHDPGTATGHDPGTAAGHDPEPPTGHDPGTPTGHDVGTARGRATRKPRDRDPGTSRRRDVTTPPASDAADDAYRPAFTWRLTPEQHDALTSIVSAARRHRRRHVHRAEVMDAALDLVARDPEVRARVLDLLGR